MAHVFCSSELCNMDQPYPTRYAAAHLPVLHTGKQWGNSWTDPKGLLHDLHYIFVLVVTPKVKQYNSSQIFNWSFTFCPWMNLISHLLYTNNILNLTLFVVVWPCVQVWMELLNQAPQQYVVAASCPWMGAWLCLMMQASHIPIDLNMLLEVKARTKVVSLICNSIRL